MQIEELGDEMAMEEFRKDIGRSNMIDIIVDGS
jgi:hypothetical protein